MGFAWPPMSPPERWALTPPFHPYPDMSGRYVSVALSVGSPRPAVSGHPAWGSSDFPPRRIGAAARQPWARSDSSTQPLRRLLRQNAGPTTGDRRGTLRIIRLSPVRGLNAPCGGLLYRTSSTLSSSTMIRVDLPPEEVLLVGDLQDFPPFQDGRGVLSRWARVFCLIPDRLKLGEGCGKVQSRRLPGCYLL